MFRDVACFAKGKTSSLIGTEPHQCGEDSFFVADQNIHTLGVADGVGGWRSAGVDPGIISRQLMHNCRELSNSKYILPHWLIAEAYWKIKYGEEVGAGSTTVCCVALREVVQEKQIHKLMLFSANLGDSGWVLIRKGKIRESSDIQTVGFNAPMQLAIIPSTMVDDSLINNQPYEMGITSHEVHQGDVLVLATDGLWDNVDTEEIEDIAVASPDMTTLGRKLVERASTNPRKPDDVTVVTAMV
eukprot:Sspe_Gene.94784::Locus_67117_Transcript_1_1_Confidence_1.000_Length_1274::g.94784::m.94784/K17508/PTC7, PPTC7; protein phosphatase PTC7